MRRTGDWFTSTENDTGGWAQRPIRPANEITVKNVPYFYFGHEEERSKNMRALYRIIVVNPKTEATCGPYFVVAKDESGALLKADLPQNVRANSDDYDFIVDRLGDVRAKKDV